MARQKKETKDLEKLFENKEVDKINETAETIAAQMEHEINPARIFQKIKFDGKTVTIQFINKKTNDKTLLEADDEPLDTFRDALQELAFYYIDICEFNSNDDIEIRGIALSQNDKDEQSVIITGLKTLKKGGKLLSNTPLTHQRKWSGALIEAIEKLKYQAAQYVDGHRKYKQKTLFDEDFDKDD